MKNVTILVNSCDLYEDAWEPFFKLFKIQWKDCPYDLVLNTETKVYNDSELSVRTINSDKNLAWSARLINVVKHIDTEFIMFFLEDEFLRSPVNTEEFSKAVVYMEKNTDVGYILMRHSEKQKQFFNEPYFPRAEITDQYQIVGLSALYRKEFMLQILREHESPWEFERFATKRLKYYPYKVLQYNNQFPVIFDYDDSPDKGYGITQRKWVKGTKELMDSYNIHVDYDKLGWYEPSENSIDKKKGSIIKKIESYIKDEYIKRKSMRK